MHDNALVAWQVATEPCVMEERLIGDLSLPLNLDMNQGHPFHPVLSRVRREAKARARELPAVS